MKVTLAMSEGSVPSRDQAEPGGPFIRLSQVLTVIRGVTYKKEQAKSAPGDGLVPLLRATNIQESIGFDDLVYVPASCVSTTQLLQAGDILVVASSGSRTVVGKAAPLVAAWKGSFGAFCFGLRPNSSVDPAYLAAFLRSPQYRDRASDLAAGTNINNLRAAHVEETLIPLPSFERQQHVVAYLDEQLSRLDASVAALHRVQANLKRYRASVLKAACEGQLAVSEALSPHGGGHTVTSGAQALSDVVLPPGWAWSTLEHLLVDIEAGRSFKCEERPPLAHEYGVLKVSALSWGKYDEDESKTCIELGRIDYRYLVSEGDFLFSRANTIELVGACVIAKQVRRKLMLSDKTLRFKLTDAVTPEWLEICLRSRLGRAEIELLSTGNQESMRNIGQSRIRQIRIPLPPLAEQRRTVAEADRRLSLICDTEAQVAANLARAHRLRRSILQSAFSAPSLIDAVASP